MDALPGGWKPYRVDGNPAGWMEAMPGGWKPCQVDESPARWMEALAGGWKPFLLSLLNCVNEPKET